MSIDANGEMYIDIEVGPSYFGGVTFLWKARSIMLSWWADTPFKNLRWFRIILLRLKWPPIKWISGILDNSRR